MDGFGAPTDTGRGRTRQKRESDMPLPMALIIDDGAPVNLMYWHEPDRLHAMLIPQAFTRGFADLCAAYGVKGKFSVVPMPGGLGRIDESLARVPQRSLSAFLQTVAQRIAPAFDITPEILTHLRAYNLERGSYRHVFEDEWVARAGLAELTDYIARSLEILRNVGLPANGLTSPWMTGIHNEDVYARAIGEAFWRVHRRKSTWYFLHCLGRQQPRWPWVTQRDRRAGRVVVTVPANTDDAFWDSQYPTSLRQARAAARRGVDSLLTDNGKAGRVRELLDAGLPITILTHWQSLFGNGSMAGLWGLGLLLERIQRRLGEQVQWMRCSELAQRAIERDGSA
jgi:hypothetical protein